jgi:cobalt transporter subunit CbtB
MKMTTASTAKAASGGAVGVRTLAIVTFLLGAGLVYLTGFSHSTTLHNAAHDPRHALAFPCH